jgi:diguanylate cyclase (GGDEF)-like protein
MQDRELGDLNVHSVFQDRDGFLWAGTEGGLFRYDGKRFAEVSLGTKGYASYIMSLTQDAGGRLWVAADNGLYVLENGVAQAVLRGGKPFVASRSLVAAALDRDGVVVVAAGALWKVTPEGKGWRVDPVVTAGLGNRKVTALARDREGRLWAATDGGVMEFDQDARTVQRTVPNPAGRVWSLMLVDRAGDVWLRGRQGIGRLRAGADAVEDLSTGAGLDLSHDSDIGLAEDTSGRVLTLHAEGIARWEGRAWRFFGKTNGLGEVATTALMVDRDGDLWYARFGHGLRKWQGYGAWEAWTTAEGLGNRVVWGMARDSAGRMVVADHGRLNVSAPGPDGWLGFEAMKRKMPEGGAARALARSADGSLWAGGGGPVLMRYAPKGGVDEAFQLPARVFNLRAGAGGDVWVATVDGIYRAFAAAGKWRVERAAEGPGAHGMIYEIAQGQHGEMWATGDDGLLHFAQGKWKSVNLDGTNLAEVSNVGSGPELAEGTVWVSGNFPGAARIVVRDGRAAEITRFTKPDLSSDRVVEIGVDRRGWTWLSTDDGVSVFDGTAWRWMTQDDGLIWNDCDSFGFFADDDGSIWIGTSDGVSHLQDPVAAMQRHRLPVKFIGGELGGKTLGAGTSVKWSSGALTMRFASPDLRHGHETRFRYKLSDVDTGWVSNDTGDARYAKVPPGKYRFEVVAENRALNAQSDPLAIEFEIRPPWWRTPWFEVLAAAAIVGLAVLVLLWRERVQSRRRHELERLVAERTSLLLKETEELKLAREELTMLATRDHLTGLWNRRAIMDVLFKELDRCRRERLPLVIVLIDLDHFKRINDTYGHAAGDDVLREVSARLMRMVRTYDAVGRYGGEELLMVLPGLKLSCASSRLEEFHQAICNRPVLTGEMPLKVTASFGVLVVDGQMVLPQRAIQMADEALYRAKAMGRARIEYVRELDMTGEGDNDSHRENSKIVQ